MVQSQFALSWEDYKSNICTGFSSLQQNGELVDMTIAADGHFVKVHQVMMALVSPYLKELIISAPCQHPVIFLNNVSYKTLCALLEYIYSGEVLLPAENLSMFVKTAKNLHIRGLDGIDEDEHMTFKVEGESQMEQTRTSHVSGTKILTVPSETGFEDVSIPAAAKKILIKTHKPKFEFQHGIQIMRTTEKLPENRLDSSQDYDMLDTTGAQDDDDDDDNDDVTPIDTSHMTPHPDVAAASSNLQYSVSIRGSLQVILNRYIYNLQAPQRARTGTRRWRCIEYRNNRCLAFLITKGKVVVNRANLHNHSFHDKKILQKIEKKAIFSALDDLEAYKQKEFAKEPVESIDSMKDEQFVSINFDE